METLLLQPPPGRDPVLGPTSWSTASSGTGCPCRLPRSSHCQFWVWGQCVWLVESGSHARVRGKAHFLNLRHGRVENASRTGGIVEVSGHAERMAKIHFWGLKTGSHVEARWNGACRGTGSKSTWPRQSWEVIALNFPFHLGRGIQEAAAPLYIIKTGDFITLVITIISTLILKWQLHRILDALLTHSHHLPKPVLKHWELTQEQPLSPSAPCQGPTYLDLLMPRLLQLLRIFPYASSTEACLKVFLIRTFKNQLHIIPCRTSTWVLLANTPAIVRALYSHLPYNTGTETCSLQIFYHHKQLFLYSSCQSGLCIHIHTSVYLSIRKQVEEAKWDLFQLVWHSHANAKLTRTEYFQYFNDQ